MRGEEKGRGGTGYRGGGEGVWRGWAEVRGREKKGEDRKVSAERRMEAVELKSYGGE